MSFVHAGHLRAAQLLVHVQICIHLCASGAHQREHPAPELRPVERALALHNNGIGITIYSAPVSTQLIPSYAYRHERRVHLLGGLAARGALHLQQHLREPLLRDYLLTCARESECLRGVTGAAAAVRTSRLRTAAEALEEDARETLERRGQLAVQLHSERHVRVRRTQ